MHPRTALIGMAFGLASIAGCGGGGGGDAATTEHGAGPVEVHVADSAGPIRVESTECGFDGERQVTASGIVQNSGENAQYVSITVRFVDGDGVRVDIATDSVSDLQPGESARWDASIYTDEGGTVVRCDVDAEAT